MNDSRCLQVDEAALLSCQKKQRTPATTRAIHESQRYNLLQFLIAINSEGMPVAFLRVVPTQATFRCRSS